MVAVLAFTYSTFASDVEVQKERTQVLQANVTKNYNRLTKLEKTVTEQTIILKHIQEQGKNIITELKALRQ